LRFVAARDGGTARAVADVDARLPGRGAYVCRRPGADGVDPDCLQLAIRRGGIARALRAPVAFDPKLVESVSR
jgi:predicted RNA-binding protein YlxR (DUF448 family)